MLVTTAELGKTKAKATAITTTAPNIFLVFLIFSPPPIM
jgi:hypothetical protein